MNTNTLSNVFNFNGSDIRIVDQNGNPWFVAKDVCNAIGIENHRNVVAELDDDEKGVVTMDTLGGPQKTTIISESGVYFAVLRSRKPEAKEFARWVRKVVIPAVLRGQHVSPYRDKFPIANLLPEHTAAIELARRHGFEGNHAVLTADKMIRKLYNVDIPELMGGSNLLSRKQETLLTPTELGEELGESARSINTTLEELGLQEKIYRKKFGPNGKQKWNWKLTEEGKNLGEYLDTGKKHSDGTPVQQIKWYESTADFLKEALGY